jgi:RNA polymerase sigma-70 factor (ECF subfamily)
LEEAQIIDMVRAGEVDAFAEIVERYQAPIQRYLYRLTGDYQMTQDLAQDTFLQAYKGILKTKTDLSLKAWLYRIATNNALQHHRRKRRLSFIPLDECKTSDVPTTENHASLTGEKMAIQETLSKVPEEQRICLVLRFVEGFKYKEIAETLGISDDAVRKRVTRGKQKFRRLYRGGESK